MNAVEFTVHSIYRRLSVRAFTRPGAVRVAKRLLIRRYGLLDSKPLKEWRVRQKVRKS